MSRQHAEHGASGRPAGSTTIRTIADELGVHPSTVSRALREDESRKISAATRARVLATAEALGFRPNPVASSLRTKKTRTVGLLIPRLADVVLARMFEGAEDRARQLGYQAITTSTRDEPGSERKLAEGLLERRVDGLILATSTTGDPYPDELERRRIPFVLLNRSSRDHPCVRGDDELGGYLATRHLIAKGHRRIALIAGPPELSTTALRRQGFERALAENDLHSDARLVMSSSLEPQGGFDAGTQLLARPDRPTAVFAVNDATAVGVMAAARDLGIRLPDDLAVCGYNDSDLSGLLPIPLTSIALPLRDMGRAAVDLLLARLTGQAAESVVLAPRLIARESTSRPARHP
ncbi:MAG: LacI family transcriptional regulator [Chloroflexi bacterium]|nr:LacI family transcriptional regulator [Chloroflexota bacterium]